MTPFTTVPPSDGVATNALAFAVRDAFPVSPGHTLAVTRRVVPDWFAATDEERGAVMELVGEVKRRLDRGVPRPDGYNVGFNAGSAVGQTVPHLHVHVIPRYAGHMDDPRGGVRYVIPSRGNYLAAETVRPLSTGGEADPAGERSPPDPAGGALGARARGPGAPAHGRLRWTSALLGREPRLLFVAHRRELLLQAASTWRTLLRARGAQARIGWFVGAESDLSADLVFASVAKLSRPEHLARLREERFDYVVVDEVHHAAADSYRRVLGAVDDSRFLLGLTATPDRADAHDVVGLFEDHVAYQAGVARGVALGRLVPFHYFGVKDEIDYANIPWRNRRFDPETLARAAQTEARMETLWRAWQAHPGRRTLVFCCSVRHAELLDERLAFASHESLRR